MFNGGFSTSLLAASALFLPGICSAAALEAPEPMAIRAIATNRTGIAPCDAIVDFTNKGEAFADDAAVFVYTHNTAMGDDILIAASRVNTQGNSNTTGFAKINQIPAISSDMTRRSMADLALNSQIPAGSRSVWFTLTFKNDASILKEAVDAHQVFVDTMKAAVGADEFTTQMVFQPLPTYFAKIGSERGGNVLGLD
ncbi:hypothetical protein COL922a_007632 [Colletotrichum nupharicola]|nr:hypothetical protein COL922a_007632 [Colletotrichum nupharicola]